MRSKRLSEYRIMWVFVFFDLPTYTALERKAASGFRQGLLKDGFTMFQYSIYIRHCASMEQAQTHTRHVKQMLPEEGEVVIMTITDKQFGMMEHFSSHLHTSPPPCRHHPHQWRCCNHSIQKSYLPKHKPVVTHGLFSFYFSR